MGNCQAAEAATVVIQHPSAGGNKVERIYWSVSAREIMSSNPGHYVALVITSPTAARTTENGTPVKQLKLLRPHDSLLLGQVYRLVSFQDVLKEFAAKKSAKLGKLLKESGGLVLDVKKKNMSAGTINSKSRLVNGTSPVKDAHEDYQLLGRSSSSSTTRGVGRHSIRSQGGGGVRQWKPALQSIAEIGT
ncbi:hypothetical protein ACH5RR_013960 [Cinchona calisaya]|uniref:DUF4228 domain-containing protein n=1 Tax=Cinchona calisaya TaxID=153742 RepID=A0ABD3A7C8_9GENT